MLEQHKPRVRGSRRRPSGGAVWSGCLPGRPGARRGAAAPRRCGVGVGARGEPVKQMVRHQELIANG